MVFCAVGVKYQEAFRLLSPDLVMGTFTRCRGSLSLPARFPDQSLGSCGTGASGSIL